MWMGANLEYKGIKDVLSAFNSTSSEPTKKEVTADWRRLASFMSSRK